MNIIFNINEDLQNNGIAEKLAPLKKEYEEMFEVFSNGRLKMLQINIWADDPDPACRARYYELHTVFNREGTAGQFSYCIEPGNEIDAYFIDLSKLYNSIKNCLDREFNTYIELFPDKQKT